MTCLRECELQSCMPVLQGHFLILLRILEKDFCIYLPAKYWFSIMYSTQYFEPNDPDLGSLEGWTQYSWAEGKTRSKCWMLLSPLQLLWPMPVSPAGPCEPAGCPSLLSPCQTAHCPPLQTSLGPEAVCQYHWVSVLFLCQTPLCRQKTINRILSAVSIS